MIFMNFIYPNEDVLSVYNIDFEGLYKKGYRGVLFDVDNTLVPFDVMSADQQLIAFIERLKSIGYTVGLVSNNNHGRVAALNENLNIPMVPNAMKPLTFKLRRLLNSWNMPHNKAIFVGDQLFTDVWVGNALGLYTVLVEPIQKKEQMITAIKRSTEQLVLKKYRKRKG